MSVLLDLLSWVCLLTGAFFCVTAGLGLLRLPDFYSRSHAGGIMDGLGVGLILLGLLLQVDHWLVGVKLLLVFFFVVITGPTAIHALAHAALLRGEGRSLVDDLHEQATDGTPSSS